MPKEIFGLVTLLLTTAFTSGVYLYIKNGDL